MKKEREVRFLASNGYIFVFNYEWGTWSYFVSASVTDPVDILDIDGTFYILTASGYLCKENATYQDGASTGNISMKLKTAWLRADIEQDMRVYWVHILGQFEHATVKPYIIKLYYDYSDTVVETISSANIAATRTSLRFKPGKQKCRAIMIEIYDTSATAAEHIDKLAGIALTVGVKGPAKLGADATV
jgi:hypothetical protein